MENENLFKGIGMVVDDHVNKEEDTINGIVKYLENDNHLPLVKYKGLPDNIESICFSSLSFLLLDWELNTLVDEAGNPIQNANLKEQNARDNVEFIKQVVDKVVIPIFIFSNGDVNSIKNTSTCTVEHPLSACHPIAYFPLSNPSFHFSVDYCCSNNGKCSASLS